MKVVVQRVSSASCKVNNQVVGKINQGYMLLVSFTHDDDNEKINKMAKKIAGLRIFDDELGKMNLSIDSVKGEILSISQFTLYANPYSGNRPSFVDSMEPTKANELYLTFNNVLRNEYHLKVEEGVFGAHMVLDPICDGPVTIILEY